MVLDVHFVVAYPAHERHLQRWDLIPWTYPRTWGSLAVSETLGISYQHTDREAHEYVIVGC